MGAMNRAGEVYCSHTKFLWGKGVRVMVFNATCSNILVSVGGSDFRSGIRIMCPSGVTYLSVGPESG
jgi:hypothetical protein